MFGRVERCFTLLLFPVALFWLAMPFIRRRTSEDSSTTGAESGLFLLAALPFLWMFIQLWVLAVLSHAARPALLRGRVRRGDCSLHRYEFPRCQVRGGRLSSSRSAINSIDEDVRFKKAFFDPNAIRTLRAQLDSVSAPGQYIMVNHMWDSAYGYYFDRNTVLMGINASDRMDEALAYYTDPKRNRVAPPTGAIFVQHKHLTDELFDKSFYYAGRARGIVARVGGAGTISGSDRCICHSARLDPDGEGGAHRSARVRLRLLCAVGDPAPHERRQRVDRWNTSPISPKLNGTARVALPADSPAPRVTPALCSACATNIWGEANLSGKKSPRT